MLRNQSSYINVKLLYSADRSVSNLLKWLQIRRKLVLSWSQVVCIDLLQIAREGYLQLMISDKKAARAGTHSPPPGGFFYLISHNEES